MTDGMRRPPRLWEQKLEGKIRASSIGAGSVSGGTSPIVGAPAPGPGGSGESIEPVPVVDPDPSTPRVPSTPVVSSSTLGLVVSWDGRDSDNDLYPAGTSVQVHVSDTTGFTPSGSTLEGVISEAGGSLLLGSLTAGSTFFVVFIAVAPDGVLSDPSAEGSAQVGLVQGPEIAGDAVITQIVSATQPATTFAEGSIWLNTSNGSYYTLTGGAWVQRQWDTAAIAASAITANQIAAQAITSKFLTGEIIRTGASPSARVEISAANGIEVFRDATNKTFWAKPTGEVVFGTASVSSAGSTVINGSSITTGSISGDRISGGTITGSTIVTKSDGSRIRMRNNSGGVDDIEFLQGGTRVGLINADSISNSMVLSANKFQFFTLAGGNPDLENINVVKCAQIDSNTALLGFSGAGRAFRVNASGEVFSLGIENSTTVNAANVRLGGSAQLFLSTSTARVKDDLQPLTGDLAGVEESKLSTETASCAWYDVLEICPTEFASLSPADNGQRVLGFIAEDVAEKFPWAAEWDDEGIPSAVNDRPILASLLAVVQQQQQTIADLTARIEALEA